MQGRSSGLASAGCLLILSIGWMVLHAAPPTPPPGGERAGEAALKHLLDTPAAPELALLMATLQTLTHKLALSADAGNARLAGFYVHESLEQLQEIQRRAPEYESLPIAVLIERMALPAYADLQKLTEPDATGSSREALLAGIDRVIESCNLCHVTTQRGFIRITRGTDVNPFNQSFQP